MAKKEHKLIEEQNNDQLVITLGGLIRKFEANKGAYKAPSYLEADLRNEFINPFFKALGWDVENAKGLPPSKKDVTVERAESGERPDYIFRVEGEEVFYVETKKPVVDLKTAEPIIQVKSYAWSEKRVKVVGLTDFEEFRLFDATLKPHPRFADQGEIFTLHYTEYLKNLDKLSQLCYDAIAAGSLEGLLLKDKKSVALRKPVDAAFLDDLNEWRKLLAKGLYKNSGYTLEDYQISDLVQRLLDRLLFLRIAEERDIVEPRGLQDAVARWGLSGGKYHLYHDLLVPHFRAANADIDGDLLKPGKVDEVPFAEEDLAVVIEELYPPKSIYRFDRIPIELIGAAYEQYLGNVIRCTPKQIKLERKHEVRKAGGVFYTPKYIVDYIVANTVGELMKGKTPNEIIGAAGKPPLRILDPACGSGSFLIGALEHLINYVMEYYRAHPDESGRDQIFPYLVEDYETRDTRLSLERKVTLLERCIFGVDLDPQAVEVSKLSLYLKVLEGERRLPAKTSLLKSLAKNIKCGNSLIGMDYFAGQLQPDQAEFRRVNPMDWDAAFSEVFNGNNPGFDAVIGNPPYSNYSSRDSMRAYFERNKMDEELNLLTRIIKYCSRTYPKVSIGCKDLFKWFTFRASELLKKGGMLGYIIPNTWFTHSKYDDLKNFIFKKAGDIKVLDLGFGVFPVTVPTSIIVFSKNKGSKKIYGNLKNRENKAQALQERISFKELYKDGRIQDHPIVEKYMKKWSIKFRINNFITLREGQHIPRISLVEGFKRNLYRVIDSKNMGRYYFSWEPKYSYGIISQNEKDFLLTKGYRIIIRKTGDSIICSITPHDECYVLQSLYQTVDIDPRLKPEFILGILNSKLLTFIYQNSEFGQKGRIMAQFRKGYLDKLPFPIINFNDKNYILLHDRMVALVGKMLVLQKDKALAKSDAGVARLDKQIKNTDREIDALVYELYSLTEGDIKIIESS